MIIKVGIIVLFHFVGLIASIIFDDFVCVDACSVVSLVAATVIDAQNAFIGSIYCTWSLYLSTFFVARRAYLGKIKARCLVPSVLHAISFAVSRCVWAVAIAHTIHHAPFEIVYKNWSTPFSLFRIVVFATCIVVGMVTEVVSDIHLLRFRKEDGAHSLCSSGAWSLCRHPNLFGELLFQFGASAIVVDETRDPLAASAFYISVACIFLLPGGIRTLEQRAKLTWGGTDEYKEYVSRTPLIMPYGFLLRNKSKSPEMPVSVDNV